MLADTASIPAASWWPQERSQLKNKELEKQGQTPLIREELVAGRLYTGPM